MKRTIAKRAKGEGRSVAETIKIHYEDVAALRKWIEPEEVAAAALFLACDESSAITGDFLKVDAGRL